MKKPMFHRLYGVRQVLFQSGLSLVELLIAMALGLLLTLGVTQIYLSSSVTYRQTEGLAYAQESTRFVAAMLTPELRSAGSFGCLAQMGRPLDQIVDNRLTGILIVPLTQALQGWEYTGTGPGDSITLAGTLSTPTAGNWDSGTAGTDLPAALAGSVVINSDVVIVNALTPLGVEVSAVTNPGDSIINLSGASGVDADRNVLATRGDCSEGELFEKSDAANLSTITTTNTLGLGYDLQTRIYEFTTTAYYIGEGTNDEPALFRRLMTPLQGPQELVSGVETLQILYGVDTGGSNAADDYVPADDVADWDTVASVRFSVMTRSRDEVLDEENSRSFDMLGSEVSQANNGDSRVRLVSVSTTALRGKIE
jgi:type IV pilus assembly protein PilW